MWFYGILGQTNAFGEMQNFDKKSENIYTHNFHPIKIKPCKT